MSDAYIALGTNVEPCLARLRDAFRLLGELGEVLRVSSVYRSAPYGYTDQPPFLNAVVMLRTNLDAESLLIRLKQFEHKLGRIARPKWHEREIDFDIVLLGGEVVISPELIIPHPDFTNRPFVIIPMIELSPDALDPRSGVRLQDLAQKLDLSGLERLSDSIALAHKH